MSMILINVNTILAFFQIVIIINYFVIRNTIKEDLLKGKNKLASSSVGAQIMIFFKIILIIL
jgi:hypothetical protein